MNSASFPSIFSFVQPSFTLAVCVLVFVVMRSTYALRLRSQAIFLIFFRASSCRVTAAKELAEKKKTGRPTAFSDKVAADIIAACRSGFTMEKAAELVGLEPRTVANWVYKRPVFGEQIKKARKEHELSLLRSIEEAGAKSWQAKAWIAERVYQYAQPSSSLEVAGAVAHAHAASPALAQLLAGMNSNAVKSVDGIVDGSPQQ